MDRALRPEKLDFDPSDPEITKKWSHWKRCFNVYINSITTEANPVNKLDYLVGLVSHNLYELIDEAATYQAAIDILDGVYKKSVNVLYARHLLLSRKQKEGESIQEFLSCLKSLSKNCDFKAVDAVQHTEGYIRDAFVSGLSNIGTRQKILESKETGLNEIVTLSTIYEDAKSNALNFNSTQYCNSTQYLPENEDTSNVSRSKQVPSGNNSTSQAQGEESATSAAIRKSSNRHFNNNKSESCYWCGRQRHSKEKCPARNSECRKCGMRGHWDVVCFSSKKAVASTFPTLATVNSVPASLERSTTFIGLNNKTCMALWDTGSAENYISPNIVQKYKLKVTPELGKVTMANTNYHTATEGYVTVNLTVNGKRYKNVKLTILDNACVDVILGISFMSEHKIEIKYGGPESPVISLLSPMKAEPPSLFPNLTSNCHPIATKSRRYSLPDKLFIKNEVKKLLQEGVIEKSNSPWRAQPFVTGGGNQKRRMVVDYSETINQFTLLDAYPLPNMNDLINKIAEYKIFSTIDLKSAYHQIEIKQSDRPFTAFEADGGLYQFCRLPFGVTNGVSCFQREMDNFVAENSLESTFPYLDNITICGRDKADHDRNLSKFLSAAESKNLTYNKDKCTFSTTKLSLLGSIIENGQIRPDPDRLSALLELPPPTNAKGLKRVLGFFSHYSKWIKCFSEKVSSLTKVDTFPLSGNQIMAFELLKKEIAESVVSAIREDIPFCVETDASHSALAATLLQESRPVAFFSRTLRKSELSHSSIEKEAQAVVEAIRHWRHFLTGRHFSLITDQKSVSFMFNTNHKGKIKNEKIMRWRMELMCYHFDIKYRPGSENIPADTLSRPCNTMFNANAPIFDPCDFSSHSINSISSSVYSNIDKLKELHISLSHPGVTRMYHFVKNRNLPFSIEDVRKINNNCKECAEIKPRFFKPEVSHLIKATQPFERLNIDFKGPLPSNNRNKYFLHIVDEFSRFPFIFPCPDVTTKTVIESLCSLFSLFGMPSYIHSDRGSSFMSQELRDFLNQRGIACSRTTPYNPEGNGQVEKFNHSIWRSITLNLRSKNLPQSHWQDVLPDVLHSARTLLCTATNNTPHERIFNFHRKSGSGTSLPTWLTTPGPVLLRRFVRNSKQDPLVDRVHLIEANPQYAFIRHDDGRETTVSIKDLAPAGGDLAPTSTEPQAHDTTPDPHPVDLPVEQISCPDAEHPEGSLAKNLLQTEGGTSKNIDPNLGLRRSGRITKEPDRLTYI